MSRVLRLCYLNTETKPPEDELGVEIDRLKAFGPAITQL